ncbi:MAG: IS4 family transposase [Acidimicrobiaceae bacterium]|nr:IS4 family transposase [Candidatus Palauibacter australiensis]MCY3648302.1 IS4 family transposase [Acidimicrobiaceae bacterium]
MQIGMRQVSAETVEWFDTACKGGELTRTALARELCERESWVNEFGRLCFASARKLLPKLAEALGVRLPEAEATALEPHIRPPPDFPGISVACTLRDLGVLSLDLVTDAADRRRWEAMIETHHPEGWRRPPGGQLRYWIRSERHGVLGGIGFTAAGIQLGPRDGVIGWSADARVANVGKVVCNNRFLLLGGVRVKGLASRALRLATARVAEDWAGAYGERPVLAQTFTGPEMSGLSYRAAGWKCCPELTSGRRSGVRRAVWLRPLAAGWREVLRRGPERVLGWSGSMYDEGGWAEREYGRSPHPDGRVRSRIAEMGAAWTRRLGEHLPAIFPGRAEQAAAYRLLSNDGVRMEHILESHFEQTVERCRAERLVLAVQDTTTLNYDGLSGTSGLDDLGGGGKGTSGILAHVGVAVNAVGRPLGMFEADADFRKAEGKDSVRWTDGLDRAQELARACPDTRVVTVCDREGDFWELISRAEETGAALLVRASRGSKRRVAPASGGDEDLWEHVLGTDPVGARKIEVPACGGPNRRKGRTARLTLRCTPVDLLPPKDRKGEAPVRMIAVSALEEDPPQRLKTAKGKKKDGPLHWMLLTTEGEAGLETARTVLRWYELRWRIERFFHALKVGTRVEDRRLDEADDLKKCLAFDAITAFRVWDLSLLARERPDDPAERHVTREDVTALCALAAHHGFKVPRGPPEMTIAGFVVLTGGLAGFHPSKRQPLPGTQKLWEGVRFLSHAVIAIRAMQDWDGSEFEGEDETDSSVLD